MEIIVCILTILFFAILEIRDIKARSAGMLRSRIREEAFVVLPLYGDEGLAGKIIADLAPAVDSCVPAERDSKMSTPRRTHLSGRRLTTR